MIHLKSKDEIERIRECGIVSAMLFDYLNDYVKEGITTNELDRISEDFIIKKGCKPSFKGYMGFPSSICASVNEEVIHGIPCKRKLRTGDIIGIDVGIQKKGYISDSARTYSIGNISDTHKKLMKRTESFLYIATMKIKPMIEINEISGTIEDLARNYKYGIVYDYCGHGVGYKNHEEPEVPNYRFKGGKKKLRPGTVIAIEPMINLGADGQMLLDDGWTVVTVDGKYSAHFENTVAVTENGFDILTIHPDQFKTLTNKFSHGVLDE